MKLKALALALFLAGAGSSYALAGNGHGHGKSDSVSTSTGTSTALTTTTTGGHGKSKGKAKIVVCHKAGKSGRWVKIKVAAPAGDKHLKKGDVLPDSSGNCPAPAPKTHTGTDETTTEASK